MAATRSSFNESILEAQWPTIFELLAQDSMGQSLSPAIQYITKLIFNTRYVPEISTVIEGTVQGISLWKYNASVSEGFYDLIRSGHGSKWRSLITIVFIPYVITKLNKLYDHLCDESEYCALSTFKRYLLLCIPYILSVWKGVQFIFQLLYLCNKTVYYSPQLWLSGMKLIRKTDHNNQSLNSIWTVLVQYIGPVCLFGLKFIEWWYSGEREETVKRISSLPIPPSPSPVTNGSYSSAGVCPLCHKIRRNPTTLSCSGFVFCYLCIVNYIRRYGVCPMTSLPANENKLIRLFITV